MKKILKLSVTVVLLVAVVAGASVLYNKLSSQYQGGNLITDQDLISSQLGGAQPNTGANVNTPPENNNTEPSGSGETENGTENSPENSGGAENGNENPPADENESDSTAPENGDNNTTEPENGNSGGSSEPENGGEEEKEEQETPEPPKNLAPDFTVLDENGNAVKLSDFRGKPVVLNFWATWCGYCIREMPDFNTAYSKYPEIQFLMVNATSNSDTVEKAKKAKADNGYNFDIFFDTAGDAVNTYNVTGFPTTYFISAEGELIAVGRGMLDMTNIEKGISMILPAKKED